MWRLWTPGWGIRGWWHWFRTDGFPWWVARHLPARIALRAFIRVSAHCMLHPDECTYSACYKAWAATYGD